MHGPELTITQGTQEYSIPLESEFVVGSRPTADLVVELDGIAPTHLAILVSNNAAQLTVDPRGTVPVQVNGRTVFEDGVPLKHRDRIETGGIRIMLLNPVSDASRSFGHDTNGEARKLGSSHLFTRDEHSQRSLRTLYDFQNLAGTATSELGLLEGALPLALHGVLGESAAILRLSPNDKWLTVATAHESKTPPPPVTGLDDAALRGALMGMTTLTAKERPGAYTPVVRSGQPPEAVLVVHRKPGDPAFSNGNLELLVAIGRQLGLVLERVRLLMEMHARDQNHERLLRLQALEAVLAAVPEGLLLVSRSGHVEPLSARGAMLWERVEGAPAVAELLQRAAQSDSGRADVRTQNGVIEVAATLAASLDACVVTLRDVTRERQIEEQQRTAERLAVLGELTASLVHELSTPLQTLIGYSDLLRREAASETAQSHAEVIATAGETCCGLVRAVLSFARAEPPRVEAVDIPLLVQEVSLLLRSKLLLAKTELSCDVKRVSLQGDRDQLRQVFLNLILNALQAIEESDQPTGWICVTGRPYDGRVRIEVSNSGPAIPEHVRGSLFDTFVTTRTTGSGLGLSTTRRIVEAHQGTIALVDAKNTTFAVELPLAPTGPPDP